MRDDEYPTITRSQALHERARGLIPAFTQTLAKGPTQWVDGVAPKYLVRGKGSRVWDVDGNEYIDWQMAVGPLSLGYANEAVDAAIKAQLADGITFSLPHPLEVEVAELVRAMVPGAECVRFSKTGCDVTSAAVRLARAFTGKNKVVCCGYHGWHDWHIGVTSRAAGIPDAVRELTSTFEYNDLAGAIDAIDDDTACVILEPTVFEEPRPGFLAGLRRACDERGALLVFDEMWTGFRVALGGAQERFDVVADLACFSKAVANGMPLSLLTGKREAMRLLDRDVFFFTTFGGEALSLAAAKATLEELHAKDVPAHLARIGSMMKEGVTSIARELDMPWVGCVGFPARTLVTFAQIGEAAGEDPLVMKSLVQQELLRHRVLWCGFHNVSLAHDESDVRRTLDAYRDALGVLARAVRRNEVRAMLRGAPVEPVFRRVQGFNTKPKSKEA